MRFGGAGLAVAIGRVPALARRRLFAWEWAAAAIAAHARRAPLSLARAERVGRLRRRRGRSFAVVSSFRSSLPHRRVPGAPRRGRGLPPPRGPPALHVPAHLHAA